MTADRMSLQDVDLIFARLRAYCDPRGFALLDALESYVAADVALSLARRVSVPGTMLPAAPDATAVESAGGVRPGTGETP